MRYFDGYNKSHINHDLKIAVDIINTTPIVNEQIRKFIEQTSNSRALFFIYKKFLRFQTDTIGQQKYQKFLKHQCYFCNASNNLINHHVDFDRNNNEKDNLITLCKFCHSRLHKIFKKYKEKSNMI